MAFESSASKIVDRPAAMAWRANLSRPVVFTNGVFDLMHRGHVECLEAARREGGALIVAINSDASVRKLGKGTDRPIVSETDRARVVAALECVDRVVIFDEPTPLELITALEPDVLVKGGDYRIETVVGAEQVQRRGGRVVLVPLVPEQSTTNLLERIRATY